MQLYQHAARGISVAAFNRDLLPECHVGCEELQSRAYIWIRTSQLPGQLPFHLEWVEHPVPVCSTPVALAAPRKRSPGSSEHWPRTWKGSDGWQIAALAPRTPSKARQ